MTRPPPLNTLLAPCAFVRDDVFLTKGGDVGLVYQLAGVDYESLDTAGRESYVHQFEAALRMIDASCRVYQYLCKDPSGTWQGRTLYGIELFLVILVEGQTAPPRGWRAWFATPQQALAVGEARLARAIATLDHAGAIMEQQIEAAGLVRLDKPAMFAFFRRLVNDPATRTRPAHLKYDVHVDYFMADAPVDVERDALRIGGARVVALVMKDAPAATFAVMLPELYAIPGTYLACLEWKRLTAEQTARRLTGRRKHFHVVHAVSTGSVLGKGGGGMVDAAAGVQADELGQAAVEVQVHGHVFGECSLTVLVTGGAEADQVARAVSTVMATHDGTVLPDTDNMRDAWLSVVPGNARYNIRRLALLETNAADLSFLFTVDQGQARDRAGRAPLMTLVTQQQTPYRYHLHVEDVGHTVVLGATGAGKTVLLTEMAGRAQQYAPRTVIFDLATSYRDLAASLGGGYLSFGVEGGAVTMNPFAGRPSTASLHFLHAFCLVLIEGQDGFRLTEGQKADLFTQIEHLYFLPEAKWRLGELAHMLPRVLLPRLQPWIAGGRFGEVFDHARDTLHVGDLQVFEFAAMQQHPAVLEPVLFYILRRVEQAMRPERLTLCLMDEAWQFITHPVLRAYVQNALKTWRKMNGTLVLATQAVEDFASADLLRVVAESCPTALLLANPKRDRETYAKVFGLNPVELELLANLRPRGQVLLKRTRGSKVLDLVLDPDVPWRRHAAREEAVYASAGGRRGTTGG